MNNRSFQRPKTAFIIAALLAPVTIISMSQMPARAQLRGGVQIEDKVKEGPRLSRDELGTVQPNTHGEDEHFEAPQQMFEVDASQDQNLDASPFAGQAMPGVPDGSHPVAMVPNTRFPLGAGLQNQLVNPTDPEESKEMQLAWDIWHRNVAEAIWIKVQNMAGTTLPHTQPIACQVGYVITRDGRIMNVRMFVRSQEILFNTIVFGAINSMQGSPILQFPQGSRRMTVEKMSIFKHNWGEQGFRSTIGDKERFQVPAR